MDVQQQTSDSFWEVVGTQRAIRRFKQQPVPAELLWRVIEAATKAPSGSNRQPWAFLIVEDEAMRRTIAEALIAHLQQNEAMRGYFERGAQSEDRSERLMLSGALGLARDLAQAPVYVIPCLHPAGADSLGAGSSIYPAVQNLLLAARAAGLGTVLTTFNAGIEPRLRTLLDLPADVKPVALIPLGFPDGRFGPTKRRPVDEVTHWGKWGATRSRTGGG